MDATEPTTGGERPVRTHHGGGTPWNPDTQYVDNLIGPSTVDAVPNATLEALVDHATVRETLRDDVGEARSALARLESRQISLAKVSDELEAEGVAAFE